MQTQATRMSSKNESDLSSASNTNLLDCVRKSFASASNYEKVRQDYPIEAVKFFLQNLRLLDNNTAQVKVLELGSGTGKFTRVMLEALKDQDVRVIASDPLEHMCEYFKQVLPGIDIIQCVAEKISLPDASVDVVIASQSFHWFANPMALEEIHRVLVPNGLFGIIWAIPDFSVNWMTEIWEFLAPLYEKKSIVLPFQEEWKHVFSLPPRKLFNDLEENLSFRLNLPSSFEEAYKFFASWSVIVSGSENIKASFRELFNEVKKKYFIDRGIDLDQVPFKMFMYWCTKKIT